MKRCPTCRARLRHGTVCHRCKTDLSPLLAVEEASSRHLQAARKALSDGEAQKLRFHAGRAFSLRRTAQARRLMACAALLDHDFELALRVWHAGHCRKP